MRAPERQKSASETFLVKNRLFYTGFGLLYIAETWRDYHRHLFQWPHPVLAICFVSLAASGWFHARWRRGPVE